MAAPVTCRESIVHAAVIICACGAVLKSVPAAAQDVRRATDTQAMIAASRKMTDPVKRCTPATDGSITVCGSDTERYRLSPQLRKLAGIGKSTKDPIPHAVVPTMMFDKLPYNWIRIGKGYPPGPAYNPLYELAKKVTDPDTVDGGTKAR